MSGEYDPLPELKAEQNPPDNPSPMEQRQPIDMDVLRLFSFGSLRRRVRVEQGGDIQGTDSASGWKLRPTAIVISTKGGVPTGGENGQIVLDTTDNRLYINVNGTWKYAALT